MQTNFTHLFLLEKSQNSFTSTKKYQDARVPSHISQRFEFNFMLARILGIFSLVVGNKDHPLPLLFIYLFIYFLLAVEGTTLKKNKMVNMYLSLLILLTFAVVCFGISDKCK